MTAGARERRDVGASGRRSVWLVALVAVALMAGAAGVALLIGAEDTSIGVVAQAIGNQLLPGVVEPGDALQQAIVVQLRLPRVVLALLVGAALAVAGAQMQGLFRNPLASPDLIGVSGGAAFAAVIAFTFGWHEVSMYALPGAAFAGALGTLLLVKRIATTREGHLPIGTLLLAGIAVGAFLAAVNSFVLTRAIAEDKQEATRHLTHWLFGGLTDRSWTHVLMLLPPFALGLWLALRRARSLDPMLEGEEVAQSLGVDVRRTTRDVLLGTALLTGGAVAVSGIVGFVGLVVPHLVRLVIGPRHVALIPVSMLVGAAFLTLADVVARVAVAPSELHLGVVTAFVGAPFFLYLLLRHRRHAEVGPW